MAESGGRLWVSVRSRLEEAVVEGWCSVEELVQYGFARELLTMEFTNWREREQAANLCRLTAAAPDEPLLVWCGNGHAIKNKIGDWVPMGWHFRAMSGIDPFVIDQTITVVFGSRSQPWVPALLAEIGETLAAHGGSAGILREQVPAGLNGWDHADAFVVSTENSLS